MIEQKNNRINTDYFDHIDLKNMDKVKLMNRKDTKYWFSEKYLQSILDSVHGEYFLLHINGKSLMSYSSTYFDTGTDGLYGDHHNGKLNRYKIRKRVYIDSGIGYLEIKFKNNKGKTNKKRILTNGNIALLNNEENCFIRSVTPYEANELQTSITNGFSRLTLVSKNFKERCTIDLNLSYKTKDKELQLQDLTIVEIKSEGKPEHSPLIMAFRNSRLKASGFSKYCVGRTILNPELKNNAFKRKIREIQKTLGTDIKPISKI